MSAGCIFTEHFNPEIVFFLRHEGLGRRRTSDGTLGGDMMELVLFHALSDQDLVFWGQSAI